MNKISAEWHKANKMPKNPSKEERLIWHIEHTKHCECRQPSEKLIIEIEEYKKDHEN